MMHVWGYHEYIGGCSVHRRDTMSTLGDSMSTLGDTMSTLEDIMSTSGDIMSTLGDVQYIGVDIMSTSGNVQYIRFSTEIEWIYQLAPLSPDVLNILQCTHDVPPMY